MAVGIVRLIESKINSTLKVFDLPLNCGTMNFPKVGGVLGNHKDNMHNIRPQMSSPIEKRAYNFLIREKRNQGINIFSIRIVERNMKITRSVIIIRI